MKRLGIYGFLILFFTGPMLKAHTQVKTINKMTELINNNGDKLFTTIYQNIGKETIILLHGGPGFPSDLTFIAETLAKKFQVITFHQRGTKQSPCKSKDYSMNAYVSDLEAVAKYYHIKNFHLLGHSWGGALRTNLCRTSSRKIIEFVFM
jgi:proline iminopeptidase